jgi:hypothetical protein
MRLVRVHRAVEALSRKGFLSRDLIFEVLESAGEAFEDAAVISGRIGLMGEYPVYRRLVGRPVLSAEEICGATGLSGGAVLGRAIVGLRREVFAGRVRRRREAFEFIKKSHGDVI